MYITFRLKKKKNCIDKKNIESRTLKNIEYIEK